jgi:hypothetical protein
MQDVQADQAGVKIAIGGINILIELRFRHSITMMVAYRIGRHESSTNDAP